ncbi:hypothetical protein HAX54_049969, partial [Datura stramonium]|nr:hypothetical protein [Datura stramonium]
MLMTYTLKSSLVSPSTLNLEAIENEIVPISNIALLSSSRCHFEMYIIENTGTLTATVSEAF